MRDFLDAEIMARALRDVLAGKGVEATHSESLELIAIAFGYENWNALSAKIEAAARCAGEADVSPSTRLRDALKVRGLEITESESLKLLGVAFGYELLQAVSAAPRAYEREARAQTQSDPAQPEVLCCSFCSKRRKEVRRLIAGPGVYLCDECLDLCNQVLQAEWSKSGEQSIADERDVRIRDFRDAKVMAGLVRDALKAKGVETSDSESLELIAMVFGFENWSVLSAAIDASEPPENEARSSPFARLRNALGAKGLKITQKEALELAVIAFGDEYRNTLFAGFDRAALESEAPSSAQDQNDQPRPEPLYCSFCGKSQHEVRKLIVGPKVIICDECIDESLDILLEVDNGELFRLLEKNEETGGQTYSDLLELARATSMEKIAYYVERGRKRVERNHLSLEFIQRTLAMLDSEGSADVNISSIPSYLRDRGKLVALQREKQRDLKRYECLLRIAMTVVDERRL